MGRAETASSYATRIRSDRAPLWKTRKPVLPILDMELTERCNLQCIHCYINRPAQDEEAQERELSTDRVQAILEEAASLGCLAVKFTGGEPLLREDFGDIYLFARKSGMKVVIYTNGTLLTERLAALLARIKPLEPIEISVYGMTRESCESVTGVPGSYQALRRGMALLSEKKVPYIVKSALLPPNASEMSEFASWASQLPWMEDPPGYLALFDLRGRRDSAQKNRSIQRLRRTATKAHARLMAENPAQREGIRSFVARFSGPPGDRLFSCSAGKGSCCVDAYGALQPCMLLRHPATVYPLGRGSLRDALSHFFPEIRKMRADNEAYRRRCARCFLKALCHQCPAKSWMEHGTLDTPVAYFCEITHAEGRSLGLLDAQESAWEVRDWQERVRRVTGRERICGFHRGNRMEKKGKPIIESTNGVCHGNGN